MVHTIRVERGTEYVNRMNEGYETGHGIYKEAQSVDLTRSLDGFGEAGRWGSPQ